jgi:hypothetical protein
MAIDAERLAAVLERAFQRRAESLRYTLGS